MAYRSTTTFHAAGAGALIAVSIALTFDARAQTSAPQTAPATAPFSKDCQVGATQIADESPLPNVASVLAKRKTMRILTMGASPAPSGRHGGYSDLIESILERALKGIDVVMINRGFSGELAADAAFRMKNEVALVEPDLVLWQVGTNDALAYVPADQFAATLKEQIDWLKAHKVDVVLVGLQFASQMLRDAHYTEIRDTLRKVAAQENVIVVRYYEAMQFVEQAAREGGVSAEEFDLTESGSNCLAQYVARAITLGVFAKNLPRRGQR
ncbi:MAG TPA: GDSL-type esterase/lipase family protein [Pseudolabrys sp.]|jgi:lysophospholipase L1-like esterase|nr:GDSL-type esterase/lipase family protein [Pseudolabrys sp.]